MTVNLTKDEKIAIINSHQKNILLNKYNLEISVIEENAKTSPDASIISNLNSEISESNSKLEALQTELNTINLL